ncbi:HAD family hydrolase [Roseovarius sp. TE539]|uniref:HAD family hydrolase n=1 Tax=Roseovarius sp. TE539 TaxID=2249812 RepID=UPI000DDFFACE|nr:HAD family hydrolase [Roseovarius sp. TE539]RBI74487.1 HAD family hydrolase [Roseovarius sp. TE539]
MTGGRHATSARSANRVDGIIFDKDGTLFDFHGTWNVWAAQAIRELAGDDETAARRIASALLYDLDAGRFEKESPVIAGTNREAAECAAAALPGRNVEEIERFLMLSSAEAPLAPAVPLAPFLSGLKAVGLRLGVMTNDTEYGARAHLSVAGVETHFDFIAGFDSGYGAKPDPGPLLAFASQSGLAPERIVMVGDSTHDLLAGRAAGMQVLGVLTGMAARAELAPHADDVFPDIGHLTAWIAA